MWALKTLTLDLVVEFETEESTATCDSLQRSPKDVVFQYPVRLMSPSLPWEVSEAVTNTVKSQLLGHCGCFVSYGRDIHSVLVLRTPQIVHSGLIGGHRGKWVCMIMTSVLFLCCRYSLKPNDQILAEDKHKEL